MKVVAAVGGIIVGGIMIILGAQSLFPLPSLADFGPVSTIDECEAFSAHLLRDQLRVGLNLSSQNTLGFGGRCYVEVSVPVANGHQWRLVIDDGAGGVDVARCTVSADSRVVADTACIDPLDMSILWSGYKSIRDHAFQR